MKKVFGIFLSVFFLLVFFSHSAFSNVGSIKPDKAKKLKVLESYGKLPLSFIENKGQVNKKVSYYLKGTQGAIYFTKKAIVFDLLSVKASPSKETNSKDFERLSFTLKPISANKNVRLLAKDKLPGKVNYLIGNDKKKWQTDIPIYKEVIYKDLYKGIDLKVYGTDNQMEYDFILYPGADPKDINMAFEGIDALSIDKEGNLVINTVLGDLKHLNPLIYQEIDGKRHIVKGSFKVAKNTFSFDVKEYNKNYPLIIDPLTLSYSTYLGGSGNDFGYGIAVDSSQNAYVTGYTGSTNFPTENAYQGTFGGGSDAFVTKFVGDPVIEPGEPDVTTSTEGDADVYVDIDDDASDGDVRVVVGSYAKAHGGHSPNLEDEAEVVASGSIPFTVSQEQEVCFNRSVAGVIGGANSGKSLIENEGWIEDPDGNIIVRFTRLYNEKTFYGKGGLEPVEKQDSICFDAQPGVQYTLEFYQRLNAWAFGSLSSASANFMGSTVISISDKPLPVADAGADQTDQPGTTVELDGYGSYDPGGNPLTYDWKQVLGEPVTLFDPEIVNPTFDAVVPGLYAFELVVNNGIVDSLPDRVNIQVQAVQEEVTGDLDGDGDVDRDDLNIILSHRNQPASVCPECDLDGDDMITALDARKLVLLCTRPRCVCE